MGVDLIRRKLDGWLADSDLDRRDGLVSWHLDNLAADLHYWRECLQRYREEPGEETWYELEKVARATRLQMNALGLQLAIAMPNTNETDAGAGQWGRISAYNADA